MLNYNNITKKGTKGTKKQAPKSAPPRSRLQRANQQAKHAMYFRLQPFQSHSLDGLHTSNATRHLIERYNSYMLALRESIAQDYENTKLAIKANEAAIAASKAKSSKLKTR